MQPGFVKKISLPKTTTKMQRWHVWKRVIPFFFTSTQLIPCLLSSCDNNIVNFSLSFDFQTWQCFQSWWGALWCFAWLSALPCLDLVRKKGVKKDSVLLSLMFTLSFSLLKGRAKWSSVREIKCFIKRRHSLREHFGRSACSLHVLLLCHVLPVHTMHSQW